MTTFFPKPAKPGAVPETSALLSPEANVPAGQPERGAVPMPPYAGPGVAAPRVQTTSEDSVSGSVSMGAGPLQRSVQVAVKRTSSAASTTNGAASRPRRATATVGTTAPRARQSFDPVAYAQAGLLHLAWSWQASGAPLRAIHTYMQLLNRYPGTPAASAAVADLVELADILAEQGNFHTALSIYDQLAEMA
jgi:hypothetical protein